MKAVGWQLSAISCQPEWRAQQRQADSSRQDAGYPDGRSPEGLSRAGMDAKRLT